MMVIVDKVMASGDANVLGIPIKDYPADMLLTDEEEAYFISRANTESKK